MGKVIIDIAKAIELRVNGATLRDIGKHFGTSAEAVRQAFQRAENKKREHRKLTRLLVAASTDEQGSFRSPSDIAKTIDDWTTILDAAKKGITLELEVADLKERLGRIEALLSETEK
ncbi:hypothetical protein ACFLV6_02460 [Chloroflexota bacterium]